MSLVDETSVNQESPSVYRSNQKGHLGRWPIKPLVDFRTLDSTPGFSDRNIELPNWKNHAELAFSPGELVMTCPEICLVQDTGNKSIRLYVVCECFSGLSTSPEHRTCGTKHPGMKPGKS